MVSPLASVYKMNGLLKSGKIKTGDFVICFFKVIKACSYSLFHLNRASLVWISYNGLAMIAKSLIKSLTKLHKPVNLWTDLEVVGVGQSNTALTLSWLICFLPLPTIKPRNSTSYLNKSHLLGLVNRVLSFKIYTTSLTCCLCSSKVLLYTRISSM